MNNNKLIAGTVRRLNRRLMPALFAAVCLGVGGAIAQAADVEVKIEFDTQQCPTDVSKKTADVKKSGPDRIKWVALDASGAAYNGGYKIYFEPFRGGKPLSTNNSELISQPVDNRVPSNVTYKYTIVGNNCPDQPLDPHIRVL